MDCKGYRSLMWPYLKDEIDDKTIDKLLTHVDECKACKEELKMLFMVSEGVRRLENDNAGYNLMDDFESRLNASKNRCEQLRIGNFCTLWGSVSLVAFAIGVLVSSLIF